MFVGTYFSYYFLLRALMDSGMLYSVMDNVVIIFCFKDLKVVRVFLTVLCRPLIALGYIHLVML